MVELREVVITSLLVGLFVIALISFGTTLSGNNNPNSTILQDPVINQNFWELQEELNKTQAVAEGQREGFFSDILILEQVEVVLRGIHSITKVFTGTLKNMYQLTFGIISVTLGIPGIVMNVFLAIITISIIFLAWRILKSG